MKVIQSSLCFFFLAVISMSILSSCGQAANKGGEPAESISQVQVTQPRVSAIVTHTDLTAVSVYQQKSYVKATMNGYVQATFAIVGKQVKAGTLLFSLITKEARAIGNAVNQLDPGLKFSGVSSIRADQLGFITAVNHQKGDYVQDGEALAVISNQNSFVFLLDLPYEFRKLVNVSETVTLTLPDGEVLSGPITGSLPVMDSVAQTQQMVISVKPRYVIPEGLIAKVQLIKANHPKAQVLPRSAVLTNETEDQFWVMKLINDSTAVKVPVTKGIENAQFIEILNPIFMTTDRIVTSGNYGIADTAKVKVVK